MESFTYLTRNAHDTLPRTAGVYCFAGKNKRILYIGKAMNLRDRVNQHIARPTYKDEMFLPQTTHIGYIETQSEIEALILEAQLIKKVSPKYNTIWKDDKNYFYIGVTKESLPRVFVTHQKHMKFKNTEATFIGPFVEGKPVKKTLSFLRRVFPYYTASTHPKKACSWCHLDLCPGPNPDQTQYNKSVKNLIALLQGKNKKVLHALEKEMESLSRKKRFEEAARVRDRVFSLERILSHARIMERNRTLQEHAFWNQIQSHLSQLLGARSYERMEAYDISNIQGKEAVGSMIVFIRGVPAPSLYRKFKIRLPSLPNDVAMLTEVFTRRTAHTEWPYPHMILIDGGKGQLRAGSTVISSHIPSCAIVALAKQHNELFIKGKQKPVLLSSLPSPVAHCMLHMRDEAHRFAKAYHSKLRETKIRKERA